MAEKVIEAMVDTVMTDKLQFARLNRAWEKEDTFTERSQRHLEAAVLAFKDHDRFAVDKHLTLIGF